MSRKTRIEYLNHLPDAQRFIASLRADKVIAVYDQKLLSFPIAAEWLAAFADGCAVVAGEELKSLESLQKIAPRILRLMEGHSRQKTVLVAVGGGSVGDFVGFLASVLKRGVRLVHVPSTWLAAMDSAHGGKTAVNVGEFKNQLGTFKEAERIVLVRELLNLQSPADREAALGELLKIGVLAGGQLYKKMEALRAVTPENLWALLPLAVAAKYKIVRRDPFEEKGARHVLNLGHTLGHAYELSASLPHGKAVLEGTRFALNYSHTRRLLPTREYDRLQKLFLKFAPPVELPPLRPSQLRELLLQDKKTSRGRLRFVLLKKVGAPVLQEIPVDEVVAEALRQGVAR